MILVDDPWSEDRASSREATLAWLKEVVPSRLVGRLDEIEPVFILSCDRSVRRRSKMTRYLLPLLLMATPCAAQLPPDIQRGQAMLDMRMMDLQRQQREDRWYRLEVARYRIERERLVLERGRR